MKRKFIFLAFLIASADALLARDKMHVLDVGYGQAVHIEVDAQHYLFDVGPRERCARVIEHLANQGVTRLSGIFISHAHPDHISALLPLVKQIQTDYVLWDEDYPADETLVADLDQVEKFTKFKTLHHGDKMRLGSQLHLVVLGSTLTTSDMNDNSLVFGLLHGKNRLLIASDVGLVRQKNLVDVNPKFFKNIQLLLWPHHGDKTDPDFRKALGTVKSCVVSVGQNPYGLPAASLKDEAFEICEALILTSEYGTATFTLDRRIGLLPKN